MAAGRDTIVNLAAGESNHPTPAHVKAAGRQAIADDFTRYTPQPGFEDLRDAIARKLRRENGIDASAEQIVVSCGGKHSLYNLLQCAIGGGDEVIVFRPYWFAFPEQVRLAGGRCVFVPVDQAHGFVPEAAAVREAVTPATKAIIINSPANPTGAVFGEDVLAELADLACERDLLVISDEVYEKFLYDGVRHVSIASLGAEVAARTVTVNSVSKTHCMTGWRIGYAAMPEALAEKVTRLQSLSTSGPCAVSQRAALAALTGGASHVTEMVAELAARRALGLERLARIDGLRCFPPQGAFYLFVDIAGLIGRTIGGVEITAAAALADVLLDQAGVRVGPCEPFGSDRHIRLCFARSAADLSEGLDRMEALLGRRRDKAET